MISDVNELNSLVWDAHACPYNPLVMHNHPRNIHKLFLKSYSISNIEQTLGSNFSKVTLTEWKSYAS
jgi:hypothetical protein